VGAARACRKQATGGARAAFIRCRNVSPVSFGNPFLAGRSCSAARLRLEPQYLEIELTETTVMDNAEDSVAILEQLSRMGVVVSIDDLGGLFEHELPAPLSDRQMKIDRSFISE